MSNDAKPQRKVQSLQYIKMKIDLFNKINNEPKQASILHELPSNKHLKLNFEGISLYSIIDLSHQISLENMNKNHFQSNESLYTSACFYINTDREFQNRSKSFYNKNGNLNLLNSSLYKTSISMCDESDNLDLVKHKVYGPLIKKYSSCEDINTVTKKGKLKKGSSARNELEMTIGLLDDKTSIGKEYRESIAIQEENENIGYDYINYDNQQLFKPNTTLGVLLSQRKIHKLQKSKIKAEGTQKALAYSKTIRDQFIKYSHDKTRHLNEQSSIDGIEKDNYQILLHENSLRNFYFENMCDIQDEQESHINGNNESFITNKQQRNTQKCENQEKTYKIDIKNIERSTNTKSIPNKLSINKSTYRKLKSKKTLHKRFISLIEDLMEVNPINRTNIIKNKINKQKQKTSYQNVIQRDQYDNQYQYQYSTPHQDGVSYKQGINLDGDMVEYYSTQKSNCNIQDYQQVITYESTEPSPKPKKCLLFFNKK